MVKALIKPDKKLLEVDVPESSKMMLKFFGEQKAREIPEKDKQKRLMELSDLSLTRQLTDREYAEMRTLFAHKVGEKQSERLLGDKLMFPIKKKKLKKILGADEEEDRRKEPYQHYGD
jgi:hypothetical protein